MIAGVEYQDFRLGADPEIRFKGMKARPHIPHEGPFGADGPNSQVGELRPSPFFCPVNLVYEMEKIMKQGYERYSILQERDWLGGSLPDGQPIGGHIHFGTDAGQDLELKLEALDKFLAPVCMMIEKADTARQRRSGHSYGKLAKHNGKLNKNDRGFKTKDIYYSDSYSHALTHDGFEYRPLASWLVSRQISLGVLSLAKVIGFQAHNKSLHRHLKSQMRYIPLDKTFSSKYVNCDKKYFSSMIPTIHRIVTTFKLFPKYEKYINFLFAMAAEGRTWSEDTDLKKRWNIIPKKGEIVLPTKKIFSFTEAWDATSALAEAASSNPY